MEKENYELVSEAIREYCENHSTPQNPVLAGVERDTYLKTHMPQMLSGHQQGLLLQFLSRMIRPWRILEIGTFTGYSAICLAQGLQAGGRLFTIEINPELEEMIRANIRSAGLEQSITLLIGNGLQIIDNLDEMFDLVFIDADKEHYIHYYESALQKLRNGGWLIADNTLWYQWVLNPVFAGDRETGSIMEFNKRVQQDSRVENLLLPFRDGLMVVRKI